MANFEDVKYPIEYDNDGCKVGIAPAVRYTNLNQFYADVFSDANINGELFCGLGAGAQEELDEVLRCYVPAVVLPGVTFPLKACQNQNAVREYLRQVYAINYFKARNTPSGYNTNAAACARVAYLRAILIKEGIIDVLALPAAKHTRYTLVTPFPYSVAAARLATEADVLACVAATPNTAADALTNAHVHAYIGQHPNAQIVLHNLDNNEKARWLLILPDLLCIAAWIFRTRGHHYKAEFEDTIRRVYKSTVHSRDEQDTPLPWMILFRDVFKAIFPIDLEEAYGDYVRRGVCSGNLVKKFSSYPAGAAAYGAVLKGFEDLVTVFPALNARFEDYREELRQIREIAVDPARKMELSINARYYGVQRVAGDETKYSAMASTIVSSLKQFADDSPLLASPSLNRLANSAPITGAVIGRVLRTVARSEAYQATVLAIQQ